MQAGRAQWASPGLGFTAGILIGTVVDRARRHAVHEDGYSGDVLVRGTTRRKRNLYVLYKLNPYVLYKLHPYVLCKLNLYVLYKLNALP